MKSFLTFIILAVCALLQACQSPGQGAAAGTTIPQTQGAQTVGNDQGQASAAETGAATTQSNPLIFNIMAAKTVNIKTEPGKTTDVAVVGSDYAEVNISGAEFGLMKWGSYNSLDASTSSGGGAAGGVGGAVRAQEGVSSSGINPTLPVSTPPTPATPVTPPGN